MLIALESSDMERRVEKNYPVIDEEISVSIPEYALWAAVIERLISDLHAPIDHPCCYRQKALRDYEGSRGYIREIIREKCGFSEGMAERVIQYIAKVAEESDQEMRSDQTGTVAYRHFWWVV